VKADSQLRLPGLEHLTLELPVVPHWLEVPSTLRELSLRVPGATDQDLRALLATCPEQLSSVGLRGTPVTGAVLADLERFPNLSYLDACDTGITKDALRPFADRRPGFRCWPNLKI
jgi:hypothetical protein